MVKKERCPHRPKLGHRSFTNPATWDCMTIVTNPSRSNVTRYAEGIGMTATYSLYNNTTEAITISEVGLQFSKRTGSTTDTNDANTILVDRTVLDNPITIQPNETKSLVYTLRFDYPTA